MRLFVAVYPAPAAVADLDAAVAPLRSRSGFRWAPVEQWHVTLAFLGDVRDEVEPDIAAAIGGVVETSSPFRLSLGGVGRFGRAGAVWVGVRGDAAQLVTVSQSVGAAARSAGATYPDRRPAPHLTVGREQRGRGRDPADASRRVLDHLASYAGPSWDVTHVDLVRSHLGPPLRHESIARWCLGG